MLRPLVACLTASLLVAACSGASPTDTPPRKAPPDAGAPDSAPDGGSPDAGPDGAKPEDGGDGGDGGDAGDEGTTTLAKARAANVKTPITVVVVVTGLHGVPGDFSQWYVEDPEGGPSSGVAVYCDPVLPSCPTLRAPALRDLVKMTGALSTYQGLLQFVPTAQTVLQANASLPPIAKLTAADLAPGASSPYRGVLVSFDSKLTVDSVTPPALYDSTCGSAGPDGGLPFCAGCSPPTYSGFQAHDGSGHELYVENFFFYTQHLQSSPECLTQPGAVDVKVGMTFSSVTGVLDYDPYSMAQALSPVTDSDYVTP